MRPVRYLIPLCDFIGQPTTLSTIMRLCKILLCTSLVAIRTMCTPSLHYLIYPFWRLYSDTVAYTCR